MLPTIRFCFCLHNHQPIGNFDGVLEGAYQNSYRPFLDLFEKLGDLPISLHTSGPLLEWLDRNHSQYVDRLARLVADGRIEVIGGAFYEPILTMIPSRDRIGQITSYTRRLRDRLGGEVRGMWVAERVWEPSLVRDLVDAGIEYTILDDFHFKNAGLRDDQLRGHYLTEDDGRLLAVFPGSEPLRYAIPFADPEETISYLGRVAAEHPGAVVTFADDGEKFGTWPGTAKHVYDDGWLEKFLGLLAGNRDWIEVTTPSKILGNVPPLGKVYLPEASYREMTEWALPVDRQIQYENLVGEMKGDQRWPRLAPLIRGGFWRNFRVKYPEANEMYARMLMVSGALDVAAGSGADTRLLADARRELYRGQCNCAYWHGAFGGIYLPHLRNAVYHHLIAAESLMHEALGRTGTWIEATTGDYNLDARNEVRLANDKLLALVAPAAGGQLYELDVRSIRHNLLATLARRPEAYHRKVLAGAGQDGDGVASIHDRVVFKQEGLNERIRYDDHLRKSLLDHFYDAEATLEAVADGEVSERGDFVSGAYQARLRRNPDRIQVQLSRRGLVQDVPVQITKGLTLQAGGSTLEIAYLLEGLPQDRPLHLAVELNFAGLPAGLDDRYYTGADGKRLGRLGAMLNLSDAAGLGLVDEWLGIELRLAADRATHFWTFPIETVSQSEGGFELVHQSIVVMPHWPVQGDADGRWSVAMTLDIDAGRAESRSRDPALAAAT